MDRDRRSAVSFKNRSRRYAGSGGIFRNEAVGTNRAKEEQVMNKLRDLLDLYYNHGDMEDITLWRIKTVTRFLNPAQRRLYLATEARVFGQGGAEKLANITGMSVNTITRGLLELKNNKHHLIIKDPPERKVYLRNPPNIMGDLIRLIRPNDPKGRPKYYNEYNRVLSYTNNDPEEIAAALREKGFKVTGDDVINLLTDAGYSLPRRHRTEPAGYTKADAQGKYLAKAVKLYMDRGEPVICIEIFRNTKKEPVEDWVSFAETFENRIKDAVPYDINRQLLDEGLVNIELNDTVVPFAIKAVESWWKMAGEKNYGFTGQIHIIAGFSVTREGLSRFQALADRLRVKLNIFYLPHMIYRWTYVGHQHLCLKINSTQKTVSRAALISLISPVKINPSSLTVDYTFSRVYNQNENLNKLLQGKIPPKKHSIWLRIKPHNFNGDFNYTILPVKRVSRLYDQKMDDDPYDGFTSPHGKGSGVLRTGKSSDVHEESLNESVWPGHDND
jgi:hypothetical protein